MFFFYQFLYNVNQAQINQPIDTNTGETILHYAAKNNHTASIHYLMKKGANINSQDKEYKTPLMAAIQQDHKNSVDALLTYPLKLDIADKDGLAAVHYAVLARNTYILAAFHQKGANFNLATTQDPATPLLLAIRINISIPAVKDFFLSGMSSEVSHNQTDDYAIAKYLLTDCGADPNQIIGGSFHPLAAALLRRHLS